MTMPERMSLEERAERYAEDLEQQARGVSPLKPAHLMLEAAALLREMRYEMGMLEAGLERYEGECM